MNVILCTYQPLMSQHKPKSNPIQICKTQFFVSANLLSCTFFHIHVFTLNTGAFLKNQFSLISVRLPSTPPHPGSFSTPGERACCGGEGEQRGPSVCCFILCLIKTVELCSDWGLRAKWKRNVHMCVFVYKSLYAMAAVCLLDSVLSCVCCGCSVT